MKIAFFTDSFLPARDGVVTSILNTREELGRHGHETYVFCAGSGKAKKANKDERVFYHRSAPFTPYPDYRVALFPFLSTGRVRANKVDLVHVQTMATMGWAGIQAAESLKIPLVGTFHTLIPEATHYIPKSGAFKKITQNLAWRYLKWFYNHCRVTIAPSQTIKNELVKRGFKHVEVVPTGIDVKKFRPGLDKERIRKKHGLGKGPVILHVGRIAKEKNLDVLIKSALMILEDYPDARFLVVGKGPALQAYEKMAHKEGISKKFVFAGFVPDEELPYYYAASDVFAFPSIFETQGLVAAEAMATGLPVAGADFLAIPEYVKNGVNGFLFKPHDSEDCANAVLKCIKQRKKLSKKARETAVKYSLEKCTRKLIGVYKKIIGEKKA